jgi:hypothetical protein
MKEFIVKDTEGFRLKVVVNECLAPKGLYSFDFINESLQDQQIIHSSTYNFFMTKEDVSNLINGLKNV